MSKFRSVTAGGRIQSLGVVNRFYRQGTNKIFKRTWTSYLFRTAVDTFSIDSCSESLQPELFRGLRLANVDFEVLCGHSSLAAADHKELFSWLTHQPLRVSALDSCGASRTSFLFKDTWSNASACFSASYGNGMLFGSVFIYFVMWAFSINIHFDVFIFYFTL